MTFGEDFDCTHRIHGTGIYTYIWLIFMVSVGKYVIHGSYGVCVELMLSGLFEKHFFESCIWKGGESSQDLHWKSVKGYICTFYSGEFYYPVVSIRSLNEVRHFRFYLLLRCSWELGLGGVGRCLKAKNIVGTCWEDHQKSMCISHRIHGNDIYTYMNGWFLW